MSRLYRLLYPLFHGVNPRTHVRGVLWYGVNLQGLHVLKPVLIFLFLSLFLALSFRAGWGASSAISIDVKASPLALDPENPGRQSFEGLTFLNGFELASTDARFGGLSGLALSQDGQILYAVSDRGYWFSAQMSHDPKGRLTGLGSWKVASLLGPDGKALISKQRDAEALVRDSDGAFIVAFERVPRLWRYPPSRKPFTQPPHSLPLPPEIHRAPSNGGMEAVTILPNKSFLILTERFKNPDGSIKGWLLEKNRFVSLSYLASDDFLPTDITTLPNGDILLLERKYKWHRGAVVRLRRIRRSTLRAGARLKGKKIILIGPPLEVDNFEGIAVRQDPRGEIILYLVSDDNYSLLQRTLLLQFRLNPTKP